MITCYSVVMVYKTLFILPTNSENKEQKTFALHFRQQNPHSVFLSLSPGELMHMLATLLNLLDAFYTNFRRILYVKKMTGRTYAYRTVLGQSQEGKHVQRK